MISDDDRLDTEETHRVALRSRAAVGILGVTGAVLFGTFFPVVFTRWGSGLGASSAGFDDEGMFVVSLRQFIHHGSLYRRTWSGYGPFYYSFMGLIYRVTGQEPTLSNGRLLTLALIALSASIFAAAVWRVTKSLAASVLCEVAAFLIVIRTASPMHPGSLIVLLVAVLAYALSSYAVEPKLTMLLVAGGAIGALAMTKINVGLLAGAAVVVVFVVGNPRYAQLVRAIVAGLAVLLPIVLIFQSFSKSWAALLAGMVSLSLLGLVALMSVDAMSSSRRAIAWTASGAAITVLASLCWPLLSGTSLSALFEGVVTKPLRQVDLLTIPTNLRVNWFAIILTLSIVYLAAMSRDSSISTRLGHPLWWAAGLAVAGLWLLGIATINVVSDFAGWLPAIVVLPALALIAGARPQVRRALRALLPLVVLQVLHAYPVAGAQVSWATVAVTVPCAIAVAAGMECLASWRDLGAIRAAVGTASLCLLLVLASPLLWPPSLWHTYTSQPVLGLRGTTFMRLDPGRTGTLRNVTAVLRQHCDTFYSLPGLDSFYMFSGLPTPTGLLANWPGVLDNAQQEEVVSQLTAVEAANRRVCILRDVTLAQAWDKGYGSGPLHVIPARYNVVIARVGPYEISRSSEGT